MIAGNMMLSPERELKQEGSHSSFTANGLEIALKSEAP
jgi:hypothetical protein